MSGREQPISSVPEAEGKIALTFDDGPNPRHTEAMMSCLEHFDTRGTFFLIGRWAALDQGLVREIVERGHAIGNHTYSHPKLPGLPAAKVRDELRWCRDAVESAGCTFSRLDGRELMRPPYGQCRAEALQTIREEGYITVKWSIVCFDWSPGQTPEGIAKIASEARGGDIVLLHDGDHSAPTCDRSATVTATSMALEQLTNEGYRIVTIPELAPAGLSRPQ